DPAVIIGLGAGGLFRELFLACGQRPYQAGAQAGLGGAVRGFRLRLSAAICQFGLGGEGLGQEVTGGVAVGERVERVQEGRLGRFGGQGRSLARQIVVILGKRLGERRSRGGFLVAG